MSAPSVIVKTPLGSLRVDLVDERGKVAGDDFALVTLQIQPALPPGMSVDEVTAVLLSISSQTELVDLAFSCQWIEPLTTPGGPESGEWLDAQSWQIGEHEVLIGTEDFEVISQRLPECGFREQPYPIEYLPFGMRLRIPKVPLGMSATFHFVVASNRFPDPAECSAWYAVDMRNARVVAIAAALGADRPRRAQ